MCTEVRITLVGDGPHGFHINNPGLFATIHVIGNQTVDYTIEMTGCGCTNFPVFFRVNGGALEAPPVACCDGDIVEVGFYSTGTDPDMLGPVCDCSMSDLVGEGAINVIGVPECDETPIPLFITTRFVKGKIKLALSQSPRLKAIKTLKQIQQRRIEQAKKLKELKDPKDPDSKT